jgi:hypothetical protein
MTPIHADQKQRGAIFQIFIPLPPEFLRVSKVLLLNFGDFGSIGNSGNRPRFLRFLLSSVFQGFLKVRLK